MQGQVQRQVLILTLLILILTPEFISEKPCSLSSQENSSLTQKAQVDLEPTSSRESETKLPLKVNQKQMNQPRKNLTTNSRYVKRKL